MKISLIVAADENNGIGLNGQLPWRLPDDLKRFRQLTLGHHLFMGRKTYESIGKPLPGRTTIVITRQTDYQPEGVFLAHSIEAAFELARNHGENEVFCCGGGEIYRQMLPVADCVYLTRVLTRLNADVHFPSMGEAEWTVVEKTFHPADEKHVFPFIFFCYQREVVSSQ
jgi:dihydrofolate reductase